MKRFLYILLPALLLCSCDPLSSLIPGEEETDNETQKVRHYVNLFAYNVMGTYYLWESEIASQMKTWTFTADPVSKVKSIRYQDDRWTQMVENYNDFVGNVSGNTKSMGFDFSLYYADEKKKNVIAVVNFTYPDSPASKAGIKRGDIIIALDGTSITVENYSELVTNTLLSGGTVRLGMKDNREITLTAVQMYENPVQTVKTITLDSGQKVGYLHYASFTLDSCVDLEETFRGFREEGIDELVLDLRYNGGGYVIAGTALASMIAPLEVVEAGSVFNKDIYNQLLTDAWGESVTPFESELTFSNNGKQVTVHPGAVNPDLKRVWVITGTGTASASESVICGLAPYMDVVLVGEQTAGKFCGGFILDAKGWYEAVQEEADNADIDFTAAFKYCGDWGIYVMVSRYTDRDGRTLSMPDGISPDHPANDAPADGHELGDPGETLLALVLEMISGGTTKAPAALSASPALQPLPWHPARPGRILVR